MQSQSQLSWPHWLLGASLGAAILLIVFYLLAWVRFGAAEAAWALLHGADIAVAPATVDLGECSPGEVKDLQFRVVNLSSARVTVTGIYTSCSCLLASSLPVTLEAQSAAVVCMKIHSSQSEGEFLRQAVLYTDSQASPQLPIKMIGNINRRPAASDIEPAPPEALSHRKPVTDP